MVYPVAPDSYKHSVLPFRTNKTSGISLFRGADAGRTRNRRKLKRQVRTSGMHGGGGMRAFESCENSLVYSSMPAMLSVRSSASVMPASSPRNATSCSIVFTHISASCTHPTPSPSGRHIDREISATGRTRCVVAIKRCPLSGCPSDPKRAGVQANTAKHNVVRHSKKVVKSSAPQGRRRARRGHVSAQCPQHACRRGWRSCLGCSGRPL